MCKTLILVIIIYSTCSVGNFMRLSIVSIVLILAVIAAGCANGGNGLSTPTGVDEQAGNESFDLNNTDTRPGREGKITIEGVGEFNFDPNQIESVRGDIFKDGYFSIFDILVHLDSNGAINMEYHFDEAMNAHVIDSINGKENWWYYAYYDGGWRERNVFRMDHYPVKDKMYIRLFEESEAKLENYHKVFGEEIERKEQNGGKVIIPEVSVMAPNNDLVFRDVEVTAHNLRSDMFQPGVITAIDVILSLADQNKITYDLKWYESIGSAGIVKNYYVERINNDSAYNRCGFVYEAGSNQFRGFQGNHIHVQSDIRVINSPEYEEWFWICI